jgi:hypothetical protein
MHVLARTVDIAAGPPKVTRFATLGQVFLTAGRKYEVHALAVFDGQAMLQIIDDLRYPAWLPAWLFEVVDASLPTDWICNTYQADPVVLAGPSFVAKDQGSYRRMVEQQADEVDLFWKRVAERERLAEEADDPASS